jgi:hypothetical protein
MPGPLIPLRARGAYPGLVALTALSNGDVIVLIVALAIPVVALSFIGAGNAFKQIGKGAFAIDREPPPKGGGGAPISAEQRNSEIRQMLTAKAYRQAERGERPLDVEAELERILRAEAGPALGADPELVAEVRALVIASNERRARMGREPLDVEAEVARQLHELENLGQ